MMRGQDRGKPIGLLFGSVAFRFFNSGCVGWTLYVVGSGTDRQAVRDALAKNHRIPRENWGKWPPVQIEVLLIPYVSVAIVFL